MNRFRREQPFDLMAIFFVAFTTVVLTFPLFLLLYKFMPSIVIPYGDSGIELDQIILFTVIYALLFVVIKRFRNFFVVISMGIMFVLTILLFSGYYTFEDLYTDYNKILYDLGDESLEKRFFIKNEIFTQEEELRLAINYNDPNVVNFARNKAIINFQEYKDLIKDKRILHYFSIFKEVQNRWAYVYDPIGENYYSKASETINQLAYNDLFKGDCDDYSILIAACIRAVGGEVKLVRTNVQRQDGTVIGHLYPEVKIGNKKEFDNIAYVLRNILFPQEIKNNPIRYYQDIKGDIWLNFDYNDPYPGGRYQSDIRVSEMRI